MTIVQKINAQNNVSKVKTELTTNNLIKEDDNIFANYARKKGMDGIANFLSDDWSENMARKAGWDNFADWIGNKESIENPDKKEGFISKSLRAMVKHPVITIVSIATIAFCGAKLYNHFNKATQTVATTASVADDVIKVSQPPKPVPAPPPKLEMTPENIEKLELKINQGVAYERGIEFSNIEILKDLPEDQRKKIINHLHYNFDDSKRFLYFATGETPATLQCVDSNRDNLYKALENAEIEVNSLFRDKGGEILVNRKAVNKIITENSEFFRLRLGLPVEATVKDIEKELFSSAYSSPLRSKDKYVDLMELILGNDIDDACHAQIVKDIRKQSDMFFYAGKADGVEEYKALLKKSLAKLNSSYAEMEQSFIDRLLNAIDSITEKNFKRLIVDPIEVFENPKSEQIEFQRMVRLAEKLEQAQKYGTNLKFS